MTDPWRYRCPEGHTISSVRQRQASNKYPYYCRQCKQDYPHLVDFKTGRKHYKKHE